MLANFLHSSDTNICSLLSQEIIIIEPDQLISNFSTIYYTLKTLIQVMFVWFKNNSFTGNLFKWDLETVIVLQK